MTEKPVRQAVRCKTCGEKLRIEARPEEREVRGYCPACRSLHFYRPEEFLPLEA